jgi:hypothetical protein
MVVLMRGGKGTVVLMLSLVFLLGCMAPEEEAAEPEMPEVEIEETPPVQPPEPEPEPEPTPLEKANATAHGFAVNSSTYAYDGSGLTLTNHTEDDDRFTFTYDFTSKYSGFGDRSAYRLEKMETQHTLLIGVEDGIVTSAVLDGVYDELEGGWIDLAANFDFTPTDRNRSIDMAIEFVKQSEQFNERAKQGSDVWVEGRDVDKISDTCYRVGVRFNRKVDQTRTDMLNVRVNHYEPFMLSEDFDSRFWQSWYTDPTADYTKVSAHIQKPKCPKGQLVATSLEQKFCYEPTGTHDMPCSSDEQCDMGACMRTSMGEFGPPAKCNDYPFGCRFWLFKDRAPMKTCLD